MKIFKTPTTKTINLGSGPNLVKINEWDTEGLNLVGCNNVWRVTDKWNDLVYAGDYPHVDKIKCRYDQYLHSRRRGCGFTISYEKMAKMPFQEARLYLGLPMYFGLAYWSMYFRMPKHLAFLGFDMNYTPDAEGNTTAYGVGHDIQTRGMPDPLYQFKTQYAQYDDPMGMLLDRLAEKAKEHDVKLYNLSDDPESVLPWDRITIEEFKEL